MSKVILEFDTYEDREEMKAALAGSENAVKLHDIWEKCFRPNRKNGYNNPKIEAILNNPKLKYTINHDGHNFEDVNLGYDLIELISEIYIGIINED